MNKAGLHATYLLEPNVDLTLQTLEGSPRGIGERAKCATSWRHAASCVVPRTLLSCFPIRPITATNSPLPGSLAACRP